MESAYRHQCATKFSCCLESNLAYENFYHEIVEVIHTRKKIMEKFKVFSPSLKTSIFNF